MNTQRILYSTKNCLKYAHTQNLVNNVIVRSATSGSYTLPCSNRNRLKLHTKNATHTTQQISTVGETTVEKESILEKLINKIPYLNVNKARLNVTGFLLFESIVDKLNYMEFFEEFNLPDTFYSWFVITELHIWMLTVRCMAEGDDGRYVRNRIVQCLWTDVGLRVKKLGASNPAGMRMHVNELSEQFQAALIAYDEGLLSSDVVLAGAIWRRMYQQGEVDPENLESLVKYIRKHIRVLDNISRDQLFSQKIVSWEPLSDK